MFPGVCDRKRPSLPLEVCKTRGSFMTIAQLTLFLETSAKVVHDDATPYEGKDQEEQGQCSYKRMSAKKSKENGHTECGHRLGNILVGVVNSLVNPEQLEGEIHRGADAAKHKAEH